jgi:hypothetical protein
LRKQAQHGRLQQRDGQRLHQLLAGLGKHPQILCCCTRPSCVMYWLAIVYSRRAAYAIIIPRLSLLRQGRARCRQCRSTHLHQRSTERILCIPSACFHLDRSTTAWRRLVIDSQTVTSQRRSSRPALLRNANAVLDTAHCHNSTQHLLEGTLLTETRSSYHPAAMSTSAKSTRST